MGRSWVAVEQTLKFLPLARVRNDIVYEPEASRQCHSLREQEEEISMSARLPPRNDIVSIYVKPPLNKWVNYLLNRCFGPLRRSRYIYIFTLIYNSALALTFVVFFCRIRWVYFTFFHIASAAAAGSLKSCQLPSHHHKILVQFSILIFRSIQEVMFDFFLFILFLFVFALWCCLFWICFKFCRRNSQQMALRRI